MNKINVSICQFLLFLDISDIAKHVEKQYYTDKDWHFKYDVAAMIKFAIVKFFRQDPYKKIVLSEEEAWQLGFQEKDGKTLIPSGGHWANKMWKEGGSKHMKIDDMLRFLYEKGRIEQVGMYLRNENLKDKSFPDSYKLRSECERIHGHIKNTVKFNVRRIMEESKELYSKFSFVVYQLLLLTNLQNKVKSTHSFKSYI